jgi:hypothetical protein
VFESPLLLAECNKTRAFALVLASAEEGRFELPRGCPLVVFKTTALDHYATPPSICCPAIVRKPEDCRNPLRGTIKLMERYIVEWHREAEQNDKSSDWYWVLGIVACAAIVVSFLFGNLLLATICGLGAIVIMMLTRVQPKGVRCSLTAHEFVVNDTIYPLHELDAYHIDEKYGEPVLRVRTNELFMPVVVVHIPADYIHEIDLLLRAIVPAEHVEESLSHKVLEIFGI